MNCFPSSKYKQYKYTFKTINAEHVVFSTGLPNFGVHYRLLRYVRHQLDDSWSPKGTHKLVLGKVLLAKPNEYVNLPALLDATCSMKRQK